jgi:hypothetical protein
MLTWSGKIVTIGTLTQRLSNTAVPISQAL